VAQKPVIMRMIATKRGKVDEATVASSADAPEAAATDTPVATVTTTKKKPGETTFTVEHFTNDEKGIRAGDTVSFNQSNKGTGAVIEGVAQRIFRWYDKDREEVKIKGTDGNRYYRFEKDVQLVAKAAPKAPEAPKAEEPKAEEPKAE
jgi:hypothetical protein